MCNFCENGFDLGDTCQVIINAKNETLELGYSAYSCDSSFDDSLKISFCPMCGTKLNIIANKLIKQEKLAKEKELREEEKKRKKQELYAFINYYKNMKLTNSVYRVDGIEVCGGSKKSLRAIFGSDAVIEIISIGGKDYSEIEREEKERQKLILKQEQQKEFLKNNSIDIYNKNVSEKTNVKCICPSCGTSFKKESYQQVFCRSKGGTICKDNFWNINKNKIKKYPKF